MEIGLHDKQKISIKVDWLLLDIDLGLFSAYLPPFPNSEAMRYRRVQFVWSAVVLQEP